MVKMYNEAMVFMEREHRKLSKHTLLGNLTNPAFDKKKDTNHSVK